MDDFTVTLDSVRQTCVGTLGGTHPDTPRWAGPASFIPQPLNGDHYSLSRHEQLIPGCVCGECDTLAENVPGGLWCVRYPKGMGDEAFRRRRARDLFAYYDTQISGYVYLLKSGPYYKIGRSKTPDERIKTLQIQLPFSVEVKEILPCDNEIEAEKWFHNWYSHRRVNGEWFELTYGEANCWGSAWINGGMEY